MPARGRYYLDANAIIGILERARPLNNTQTEFLLGIKAGGVFCVTSELTIIECTVKPLRDGNDILAARFISFLDQELSMPPVPLSREILMSAARGRAIDRLKLPDAIHVATAAAARCAVFVSADKSIRLPSQMRRIEFEGI